MHLVFSSPARGLVVLAIAIGCTLTAAALRAEAPASGIKLAVMDLSGVKGVDADTTRVVG